MKLRAIFTILLAGLMFTGCDEKTNFDSMFNDFDPSGKDTYLVFMENGLTYVLEKDSMSDETTPLRLKIYGPPVASAATADIAVDPSSTAVEGTHFDLSSKSVSIEANGSGASVSLTIHAANFAKGDTLKLVLTLTSGSFKTDAFASTADITLMKKPECPFDIATFLGGYSCDETGYGVYSVSFFADPDVENRIHNTNYWDFAAPGATVYYDLNPDDGTITVPDQPFTYGDDSEGSVRGDGLGTFDPCTGDMWINTIAVYGGADYPTEHHFFKGKKSGSLAPLKRKGE